MRAWLVTAFFAGIACSTWFSTGNNAGSTAGSSSSSGGLKTWQVALIICCGVLIFTVAVVSVLSCYCKARNRLYENEDDQADATYYEQQYPRQRQDVVGTGGMATPTLFSQMPASSRDTSRSGSFTNELKPMYAGSAHGSSDRLVGLAPVHMRNSSGDLAGMAGSYSNERIMSGNYQVDRRPSGSNRSVGRRPSLEQTYTAHSDEEEKTQRTIEEDEQVETSPHQTKKKQQQQMPRRSRKGFLENSQLTEKDRRQVRYKERELMQSIKENANDLAKLTSDKFDEHTEELDQMYENVCYPREANLDASNLDELNVAVGKQSQALGSSDLTKYDTTDLIRQTQGICTAESQNGAFDWNTLGSAAGACFRSVPEISFLFGLMDTEVVRKERKRARRAQEDVDAREAQPTEYTNKKDKKDAQARRLEVLQTTLTNGNRRQPMFEVLVNPKSFAQTVENLFDTSFLVRNSSVEIGVDENTGLPYLQNHEGEGNTDLPPSSQSIISITPDQWEQIAQLTGREEPVLGHRS
ncbi:hypothetical protein BBJ29_007125 [Phytophthora kernoviae]|uniref:Non-structural maintenance of chromosomes element 4 n=1 Tax=Phytophthora kernoviae TaxID=325452 RepID=A0A3F2RQL9_9STRA|nr:hypothetical protein BBJ29_007125 [Phytophthora kernoviae]RLN61206.1 hypothetical protein BBP00_00005529 [Phytophthora kernoviae]